MPFIKCDNASFSYDGSPVLENVCFSFDRGDYLCVVGSNGSGKSTLVKGILNLKKPFSGSMEFSKRYRACKVGYMPQQSAWQRDFPACAGEVVLSGCAMNFSGKRAFKLFYNKNDRSLAENSMQKLKIAHLQKRCFRELSLGQQRRVLLARALCAAKDVLVLDEPVSGLDFQISEEFYALLGELNLRDKMSIIMVTHDHEKARQYANCILDLSEGRNTFERIER